VRSLRPWGRRLAAWPCLFGFIGISSLLGWATANTESVVEPRWSTAGDRVRLNDRGTRTTSSIGQPKSSDTGRVPQQDARRRRTTTFPADSSTISARRLGWTLVTTNNNDKHVVVGSRGQVKCRSSIKRVRSETNDPAEVPGQLEPRMRFAIGSKSRTCAESWCPSPSSPPPGSRCCSAGPMPRQ
jgi:hypothetical protein